MKKYAKILFFVDNAVELRTYEYKEHCKISQEDELVYIKTDDNFLVVKAEHFISAEKVEE